MKLSICTPLRVTDSFRRRNWAVVSAEMTSLKESLDFEWVVAEQGGRYADIAACTRVEVAGSFTRSKARNIAMRASHGDLLCFLDADLLMSPVDWQSCSTQAAEYDCFSPCISMIKLGPQQTWNRLQGNRFLFDRLGGDLARCRTNLFAAIAFCRRQFIEEVGGWDERFKGWGWEDTAMSHLAYQGHYSIGWGSCVPVHLYHTTQQRNGKDKTSTLYRRLYKGKSFERVLAGRGVAPPQKINVTVRAYPVERSPTQSDGYPKIDSLLAVTSLSRHPFHLSRQHQCLQSWVDFGLKIIAVNTADEIENLQDVYPQVSEWQASEKTTAMYEKPTQRIAALAKVAIDRGTPILIMNSDIELHGAQSDLIDAIYPGHVTIGLRYNYSTVKSDSVRERFGFDAFYLDPLHAASIQDLDFGIGKSVWDWWLPLHFCIEQVPLHFIGYPLFYHAAHKILWSKAIDATGRQHFREHYGPFDLDRFRNRLPYPPNPNQHSQQHRMVSIPAMPDSQIDPQSKCAVVTLVVGDRASQWAAFTLPRMRAYAASCGADFICLSDDQSPDYPLGNKFRLMSIAANYDRILYIDADAFVSHRAPSAFDSLRPEFIHIHQDRPLHATSRCPEIRDNDWLTLDSYMLSETQGVDFTEVRSLNTGVVLFDRDHAKMWERPQQPFVNYHTAEQSWTEMNCLRHDIPIRFLEPRWNHQYWMGDFESAIEDAYIVHMAAAPWQERLRMLKELSDAKW